MARLSLAELKARNQQKEQKKSNQGFFMKDVCPFWNINEGQDLEVRLLADLNEENPDFWYVERMEHKISINGENKMVWCLAMYGEECPLCKRSQLYYKKEGKESVKGKYYWRSVTYLMRGLVVKSPLPPDPENGSYEGKVWTFPFGRQIKQRIDAELSNFADDDPEPWNLANGFNFIIKKIMKQSGDKKFADYTTSMFARRATAIPQALIDTVQLIALDTLLPQNPGREKVLAQLEAHDTGKEYSDESASAPVEQASAAVKETKVEPIAAQVVETTKVETPAVNTTQTTSTTQTATNSDDESEESILERIRNRSKNRAAP